MALTQVYTAIPNDVITAARWNNEFGNIYNNGTNLAFPATTSVSFAGQQITLDSAGQTTVISSGTKGILLNVGAKAGTPGNAGSGLSITGDTITDNATAASGTRSTNVYVGIAAPTLAATNLTVTTTDAATVYIAGGPIAGTNNTLTNKHALWVDSGNVRFDEGLSGTLAFGGFIAGLTYSNNAGDATNDIDIQVGAGTSVSATPSARAVLFLNTAVTKRLDASWVTGTNQGGLSSSLSIGNNDYYIHLIRVAGVDDIGFDTSATAANLTTDHSATHYRPIGWIKRVGGTIVALHTYELTGGGLELLWDVPTIDINLSNTLTTTRRTDAVKVPLNFSVQARLGIHLIDASAAFTAFIGCPDHTDAAATAISAANTAALTSGDLYDERVIRTSAAGLIAARSSLATVDTYQVSTYGFLWSRR